MRLHLDFLFIFWLDISWINVINKKLENTHTPSRTDSHSVMANASSCLKSKDQTPLLAI